MADITLNFSSQWPSIQVAKVIALPETNSEGETDPYPYVKKYKHNLGYPPLAIAMGTAAGVSSYNIMQGVDVDGTYVYYDAPTSGRPPIECIVVYAIDISSPFNYEQYTSEVGDVVEDTSGGTIDLRKFLLHSRAVSPMVLNVTCEDFTSGTDTISYTHSLSYPTFSFGYIRIMNTVGVSRAGIWQNVPLQGQAWPVMATDGFTSTIANTTISGGQMADKGSIITLRNPAIITNNTVNVTL